MATGADDLAMQYCPASVSPLPLSAPFKFKDVLALLERVSGRRLQVALDNWLGDFYKWDGDVKVRMTFFVL